jgi:DNA primase large subunit
MKTTETAKLIRKELTQLHPEVKFSVRKVHAGTIYVFHNVEDSAWRTQIQESLKSFESWNDYQTNYVFEQYAI